MIEDFCKFIQDIEKDPKAPVHITVRDYYNLQEHVRNCDNCSVRIDRTISENNGGASPNKIGFN